jgi:excinuclease ABC subunit C
LRQCEDSFFNNRSRPCLQHQIKRCSAPCTGVIGYEAYQRDVGNTILFLEGKSDEVINGLVTRMEQSAAALNFEEAALYRDQIKRLRQVQERQHVSGTRGDLDVIAVAVQGGEACVQVFFFRDGRLLGNNHYFPKIPQGEEPAAVLSAFISQYYARREIPEELVVSHQLEDRDMLCEALHDHAGHRVAITSKVRSERARWLDMAVRNARHALGVQLSSKAGMRRRFEALQEALEADYDITRLECFDISHTMGEATVASCVVFNEEGPLKSDYRRYNIEGIIPGDDYAAMKQALTRRYTRIQQEDGKLPDILFIAGGKGQITQAREVMEELQVAGVTIIGIAKGADRKAGLEMLYRAENNRPIVLRSDSAALHLIQQIRDEAHRFAITGHRQRRAKARTTSVLESIPGVGPKRRQRLLKQFGGLQQLARAGVEDIAGVEGVSRDLAQRIYDAFRE